MLHKTSCISCGLALAWMVLAARSLPAQDAVLDDYLGSGVHNFYERDYAQAMRHLSVAIEGGSKDPRTYYYRALAKLRAGDTYGAQEDMQLGASMESADVNSFYPVGRSLERIQGAERRELERYRKVARAQARQRQLARDAARYEQLRLNESEVLRGVPVGPPPAPLGRQPATTAPAVPAPPPAVPPTPADEVAPAEMPPAEAPAEPPPADAPAEDDPFPAGGAAEEPPAAEPAADGAVDNPFADDQN